MYDSKKLELDGEEVNIDEFDDIDLREGFYPFFPDIYKDIKDYTRFHNAIDRFMWLLRLRYSEKETIKSKKYRLDVLFQQYIITHNICSEDIAKRLIGEKCSKEKFIYFLQQGWYNELAMAYPFVDEPLNLKTSIRFSKANWKVDLFPSWYIIKSYYAMYSYYNALVFTNSDSINTFQHRKSTCHFNCALLKKFSNGLFYYPFNISVPMFSDIEALRGVRRKEWEFGYSKFPRDSKKTIYDIEKDFIEDLKGVREELKCKAPVSIIDLVYLFRVWANYIGNDTIVRLQSGGLLLFLERNLYSLTFFIAGFCEMLAIAFLGEREFIT